MEKMKSKPLGKMTRLQKRQVRKIKKTLAKFAEEKGWETTYKPINGKEIQVTHTITNGYGYPRIKTITVNPDINPAHLERRIRMDSEFGYFPPTKAIQD